MHAERTAAEERRLVDLASHFDAGAARGGSARTRYDGNLPAAVIDVIKLEWDERDPPAARHDAGDAHGLGGVLCRLILELRDANSACGAARGKQRDQNDDG